MDEATGFKTRSILCFPIKTESEIVGVAQLCNKRTKGSFDYFDERVAMAFSIYCGLAIVQCLMYEKIEDAQARSRMATELLMYHMQVQNSDVADVLLCPGNHKHPDLDKFYFSPRDIILKETPCFVLLMITDMEFLEMFRIAKETLTRSASLVSKPTA